MTGNRSKKSPCDQEEVTVTSAQPVRGLGPSRLHVAGCRIMSNGTDVDGRHQHGVHGRGVGVGLNWRLGHG